MLRDSAAALSAAELEWKTSSVQVLWGDQVPLGQREELRVMTHNGKATALEVVQELEALGTRLNGKRDTQPGMAHRLSQGTQTFWKHKKTLQNRDGTVQDKLKAFVMAPQAAALYTAGTWHFNGTIMRKVKKWEGK